MTVFPASEHYDDHLDDDVLQKDLDPCDCEDCTNKRSPMKKPDRFERMVRDRTEYVQLVGGETESVVSPQDAVSLLRREHAWMRRMAQDRYTKWNKKKDELKRRKMSRLAIFHFVSGLESAYEDILTRLKEHGA